MTPVLPRCIVAILLLTPALRADGYEETVKPTDGVVMKLRLERTAVALSGHLDLRLTVEGPTGLEIDAVTEITQSKEWEARPGKAQVSAVTGGRTRWEQSFQLEPFPLDKDKKLPLAIAALRYRVGTGDWREQPAWKPIEITVTSEVDGSSVDDAKGITGIEKLPPVPAWTAWKIGGLVGLVAVGGIALVAWRLRRRLPPTVPEPPPHEWALFELDQIEALDLPSDREVEKYHTLISDVLRRYLELRFGLHAPEQTTPEFLSGLRRSTALQAAQQEQLREFLERCDLAKFARAEFTASECRIAVAMARQFIGQTAKQSEMPSERNGQPAPAR